MSVLWHKESVICDVDYNSGQKFWNFKDSYKKVLPHGGAWQYHPFYYTMNIKEHLMRNLFQMKIIPRCHNLFSRRTLK